MNFFIYKIQNTKYEVQELLALGSKVMDISDPDLIPVLINCNDWRSSQYQGVLNRTPPVRFSGNFSKYKLDKIVTGGKGKNKYPASQAHCT
jgi:hypothetical protein